MKDQVWAIRKVCADLFSHFAMRCRRQTRELILTEHFIRLLDDNSRWVKIAAYKSLGPFIATFIRTEAEKVEFLNQKREEEEKKEAISASKEISQESESQSQEKKDNETDVKSAEETKKVEEEVTNNEDVHMSETTALPSSPPSSSDSIMPSLE